MALCLMPVVGGTPIVLDREFILIGRSPECDVVLSQHLKVSPRHCCIIRRGSELLIRDFDSLNGVYLNGKRIESRAPLRLNDQLSIGGVTYVLQTVESVSSDSGLDADGQVFSENGAVSADAPSSSREPDDKSIPLPPDWWPSSKTSKPPARSQWSHRPSDSEAKKPAQRDLRETILGSSLSLPDDVRLAHTHSSEEIPVRAASPDKKRGQSTDRGRRKEEPTSPGRVPSESPPYPSPPSSTFDLAALVALEQEGTAVIPVDLICRACGHRFQEVVEKTKQDDTTEHEACCPRCSAVVKFDPFAQPRRHTAQATTGSIAGSQRQSEPPTTINKGYVSRRRLGRSWAVTGNALDLIFLAGIAASFSLIGMFTAILSKAFGELAVHVGATFIPFGHSGTVELHGTELVQTGVAMVIVGAVPLVLAVTVRKVADELFLIVLIAVGFGAAAAWIIWVAKVMSIAVFLQLCLFGLFLSLTVVLAGGVRCSTIRIQTGIRKWAIGSVVLQGICLGFIASIAFGDLKGMIGDADFISVPHSPAPLIGTLLFGIAAQFLFAFFLLSISRYVEDDQLSRSIHAYLIYHAISSVLGFLLLALLLTETTTGWMPGWLALAGGFLAMLNIVWFFQIVGFARYIVR